MVFINIEQIDDRQVMYSTPYEILRYNAYKQIGGTYGWGYDAGLIGNFSNKFAVDTRQPKVLVAPYFYTNNGDVTIEGIVYDYFIDQEGGRVTLIYDDDLGEEETVNATITNSTLDERIWSKIIHLSEGRARDTNITIEACDKAGNCNYNMTTVHFDSTKPTLSCVISGNVTGAYLGQWYKNLYNITCTGYDAFSGIVNSSLRYCTTTDCDPSQGHQFNSDYITISPDGKTITAKYVIWSDLYQNMSIVVNDMAGNPSVVWQGVVKIDTTAPTTNMTSEYVVGSWTNQTAVQLFLDEYCEISGCAYTRYYKYLDDFWANNNFGDWTTYMNHSGINVMQEGVINILYRSVDNAQNYQNITQAQVKIDRHPPEMTIDRISSLDGVGVVHKTNSTFWRTSARNILVEGGFDDNMLVKGTHVRIYDPTEENKTARTTEAGVITNVTRFIGGSREIDLTFDGQNEAPFYVRVPKGAKITKAQFDYEPVLFAGRLPSRIHLFIVRDQVSQDKEVIVLDTTIVGPETSPDFSSDLQNALFHCTTADAFCDVEFFGMDTEVSKIKLSNLLIEFELPAAYAGQTQFNYEYAGADSQTDTLEVSAIANINAAWFDVVGIAQGQSLPSNVNITIGGREIYFIPILNRTEHVDFKTKLQEYINTMAVIGNDNVSVPLIITSDSAGTVRIDNLLIRSDRASLVGWSQYAINFTDIVTGMNYLTLHAKDSASNEIVQDFVVEYDNSPPNIRLVHPVMGNTNIQENVTIRVETDETCLSCKIYRHGWPSLDMISQNSSNTVWENSEFDFVGNEAYISINCSDVFGQIGSLNVHIISDQRETTISEASIINSVSPSETSYGRRVVSFYDIPQNIVSALSIKTKDLVDDNPEDSVCSYWGYKRIPGVPGSPPPPPHPDISPAYTLFETDNDYSPEHVYDLTSFIVSESQVGDLDGDYQMWINCRDMAGNWMQYSNMRQINFSVELSSIYFLNVTPNNNETIGLETDQLFVKTNKETTCFVDNLGTGNNENIRMDGILDYEHNYTLDLTSGDYRFEITCTDEASNTETTIAEFSVDVTAPDAVVLYPLLGAVRETGLTAFNTAPYNASDASSLITHELFFELESDDENSTYSYYMIDNVTNQYLAFNGGTQGSVQEYNYGPTNFYANLPDSIMILFVNATDVLGNSQIVWFKFTKDLTPPTLDVLSPRNGEIYGQSASNVVLQVRAADNIGLRRVWAEIFGTEINLIENTLQGTYESTVPLEGEGILEIWFHAIDESGNTVSENRTVAYDKTPPVPPTQNIPQNSTIIDVLYFEWQPIINDTTLVRYVLDILEDGEVIRSVEVGPYDYSYTFSPIDLDENVWYQWRVTAVDVAGNTGVSGLRTFMYDKSPPMVPEVYYPTPGYNRLATDALRPYGYGYVLGYSEPGSVITYELYDQNTGELIGYDVSGTIIALESTTAPGNISATVVREDTNAGSKRIRVDDISFAGFVENSIMVIEGNYEKLYNVNISSLTCLPNLYCEFYLTENLLSSIAPGTKINVYNTISVTDIPGVYYAEISTRLTNSNRYMEIIVNATDIAGNSNINTVRDIFIDILSPIVVGEYPINYTSDFFSPVWVEIEDQPAVQSGLDTSDVKMYLGYGTVPQYDVELTPLSINTLGSRTRFVFNTNSPYSGSQLNRIKITGIKDNAGNTIADYEFSFNATTNVPNDPERSISYLINSATRAGNCLHNVSPVMCYSRNGDLTLKLTFNESTIVEQFTLKDPQGTPITPGTGRSYSASSDLTEFTFDFTDIYPNHIFTDGQYSIDIRARKNYQDAPVIEFKTKITLDNLTPEIDISSGVRTLYDRFDNHSVFGQYVGDDVSRIVLAAWPITGGAFAFNITDNFANGHYSLTYDLPEYFGDGVHQINVTAHDYTGLYSSFNENSSVLITVDTSIPKLDIYTNETTILFPWGAGNKHFAPNRRIFLFEQSSSTGCNYFNIRENVSEYNIYLNGEFVRTVDPVLSTQHSCSTLNYSTYLTSGLNNFTVKYSDIAGNEEVSVPLEIYYDNSPPEIVSSTPPNGTTVTSRTQQIDIVLQDVETDIRSSETVVEFNGIDITTFVSYNANTKTLTFVPSEDTELLKEVNNSLVNYNLFKIYLEDLVGNSVEYEYWLYVDGRWPILQNAKLINVNNDNEVQLDRIFFNVSAAYRKLIMLFNVDMEFASLNISIDGIRLAYSIVTNNPDFKEKIIGLDAPLLEGVYNVSYISKNVLTQTLSGMQHLDFIIDRTNPTITLSEITSTADQGGFGLSGDCVSGQCSMLGGTLRVKGVVGDNQELGSVTVWEGGSVQTEFYNGTSQQYSVDFAISGVGEKRIGVTVRDEVGNSNTTFFNVTVDTNGPIISLMHPITGYTNENVLTILVNTSEQANCGINLYGIGQYLDMTAYNSLDSGRSPTGSTGIYHEHTIASLSQDYDYTITCTDVFGNPGIPFEGQIRIDSDVPRIETFVAAPRTVTMMPLIINLTRNVVESGSGEPETVYCDYEFNNTDNEEVNFTISDYTQLGYVAGQATFAVIIDEPGGITPAKANGNWTVNATCYDRAGQSAERGDTFEIITDAPLTISIDSPSNNSVLSNNFTLVVRGDKNLDFCNWRTDSSIIRHSMIRNESYTGYGSRMYYPLSTEAEGPMTIMVNCMSTDQRADTAEVTIVADKNAPNIELINSTNTYRIISVTGTTTFADGSAQQVLDFNNNTRTVSFEVPAGAKIYEASLKNFTQFDNSDITSFKIYEDSQKKFDITFADFKDRLQNLTTGCDMDMAEKMCTFKILLEYSGVARINLYDLDIGFTVEPGLNPYYNYDRTVTFMDPSVTITKTMEVSSYAKILSATMDIVPRPISGILPENVTIKIGQDTISADLSAPVDIKNALEGFVSDNCDVSAGYTADYCRVEIEYSSDNIGQLYLRSVDVDTTRSQFVEDAEMIDEHDGLVQPIIVEGHDVVYASHSMKFRLNINDSYSNITEIKYGLFNPSTNMTLGQEDLGIILEDYNGVALINPTQNLFVDDITVMNILDGKFIMIIDAYDQFGHSSRLQVPINVDTKDPIVNITQPLDNAFINDPSNVLFEVAVQDEFGIESVSLSYDECGLDGGDCALELVETEMTIYSGELHTGRTYNMTSTLTPTNDNREYNIVFKVKEPTDGGNESFVSHIKLTYDRTLPSVFDLDSPKDNEYFNSNSVFNWTPSYDLHFDKYVVYLQNTRTGENYTQEIYNITSTTFVHEDFSGEDTYEWWVVAYDKAGNFRESNSRNSIVFDSQPPTRLSVSQPNNNSYVADENIEVIGVTEQGISVVAFVMDSYGYNLSINSTTSTQAGTPQLATISGIDAHINHEDILLLEGDWTTAVGYSLVFTNDEDEIYRITNDTISGSQWDEVAAFNVSGRIYYENSNHSPVNLLFNYTTNPMTVSGTWSGTFSSTPNTIAFSSPDGELTYELNDTHLNIIGGQLSGVILANMSSLEIDQDSKTYRTRQTSDYKQSPKLAGAAGALYTIIKLDREVETDYAVDTEVKVYPSIGSIPGGFSMGLVLNRNISNDVVVRAVDEAGNTLEQFIPNIKVDGDAPEIKAVNPPHNIRDYVTNLENFTFEFTIDDSIAWAASGVNPSDVTVLFDRNEVMNFSHSGFNPMRISFNVSNLFEGRNYSIEIIAKDKAGNIAIPWIGSIVLDKSIPVAMNISIDPALNPIRNGAVNALSFFVEQATQYTHVSMELEFFSDLLYTNSMDNVEIVRITVNGINESLSGLTNTDGVYSWSSQLFEAVDNSQINVYARSVVFSNDVETVYSATKRFTYNVVLDNLNPRLDEIEFVGAREFDSEIYTARNPVVFIAKFTEYNPYKLFVDEVTYGSTINYTITGAQGETPELGYPYLLYNKSGRKNFTFMLNDHYGHESNNLTETVILDIDTPGITVESIVSYYDGTDITNSLLTGSNKINLTVSCDEENMYYLGIRTDANLLLTSTEPAFVSGLDDIRSTVSNDLAISVYAGVDERSFGQKIGIYHPLNETSSNPLVHGRFEPRVVEGFSGGNVGIYIYNDHPNQQPVQIQKQIITLNTDQGVYSVFVEQAVIRPTEAIFLYVAEDGSTYHAYDQQTQGRPDLNVTEAMTRDFLFGQPDILIGPEDYDLHKSGLDCQSNVSFTVELIPGDNDILVYGEDKAGNNNQTLITVDYDYSPPNITITSQRVMSTMPPKIDAITNEEAICVLLPSPNETISLNFEMSSSENGLFHTYTYGDTLVESMKSDYSYEFGVQCTDVLRNSGTVIDTFIIDSTPPVLEFDVAYSNVQQVSDSYFKMTSRYKGYVQAEIKVSDVSSSLDKNITCDYTCLGEFCNMVYPQDEQSIYPDYTIFGVSSYEDVQSLNVLYPYLLDEFDYLLKCKDQAGNVAEGKVTLGVALPYRYTIESSLDDTIVNSAQLDLDVVTSIASEDCKIRRVKPNEQMTYTDMVGSDVSFNYVLDLSTYTEGTEFVYNVICNPFNYYEYNSADNNVSFVYNLSYPPENMQKPQVASAVELIYPEFDITRETKPNITFSVNSTIIDTCAIVKYTDAQGRTHTQSLDKMQAQGVFDNYTFEVESDLLENAVTDLTVTCNKTTGQIIHYQLEVEIDSQSPTITSLVSESGFMYEEGANRWKIVRGNGTHAATRLFVESDEEVFCRYDEDYKEQFEDMAFDFVGDGELWRYKYVSRTPTLYIENGTGANATKPQKQYNIRCVDLAGNQVRTFEPIRITVDIGRSVNIFNITPEENGMYVNQREFTVSFWTHEFAKCSIDEDTTTGAMWDKALDWLNPPEAFNISNGTRYYHHEYTVTDLTDGYGNLQQYKGYKEYGFEIECTDPTGKFFARSFEKSFKVDVTSPEINITEHDGKMYNTSEVPISFNTENWSKEVKVYVNEILQHNLHEGEVGYDYHSGQVDVTIYLINGSNKVRVEVIDKADNTNSAEVTVYFNNSGPMIKRVIPDRGIFRNMSAFDGKILAYLERSYNPISLINSSIRLLNETGSEMSINREQSYTEVEYIEEDKDDLLMLFDFDSDSVTQTDELGNVGMVNDATWTLPGLYSFDGVDGNITLDFAGANLDLVSDFTLTMQFRIRNVSVYNPIISFGGIDVYTNDSSLYVSSNESTLIHRSLLPTSYSLAIVSEGGIGVKTYLAGSLFDNVSFVASNMTGQVASLVVGSGDNKTLNGTIDNVRIDTKALSMVQVNEIATNGNLTKIVKRMEPVEVAERSGLLRYNISEELPDGVYYVIVEAKDINGTVGEISYTSFSIDENATLIELLNITQEPFHLNWQKTGQTNHTFLVKFDPKFDNDEVKDSHITLNFNKNFLTNMSEDWFDVEFVEGWNKYYITVNTTNGYLGETFTYYTELDTQAPESIICIGLECSEAEASDYIEWLIRNQMVSPTRHLRRMVTGG